MNKKYTIYQFIYIKLTDMKLFYVAVNKEKSLTTSTIPETPLFSIVRNTTTSQYVPTFEDQEQNTGNVLHEK